MADRTVAVRLIAITNTYQAKLAQAAAQTKSFEKTVVGATGKTREGFDKIGAGAVVVGGAMLWGFGKAVGASMEFEKAMSGVAAVSNSSAEEMKLLSDAALAAGASTKLAGVTAMDAARAEEELVKAGVSVNEILDGALIGSLSLASAGQLDFGQAAEISAQAMNIWNLEGSEVGRIADTLAAGANKSAADVTQLGDALRQGGLVAEQTGIGLNGTVGALALFADNALVGSDAGTSFKSMLQRLTPQSKEAEGLMEELGISAYDASGNFVGLAEFAGNLQSSLKDLTPQQRNTALATIFGSDAVRAANVIYKAGESGIREYTSSVNDQGAASRMAAKQMDNLAGDVEVLGGAIETALITSGTTANGVLRDMVQFTAGLVNAYNDAPPVIQGTATALLGVGGAALVVAGGALILIPRIAAMNAGFVTMGTTTKAAALGAARVLGVLALLPAAFDIADDAGNTFDEHMANREGWWEKTKGFARTAADFVWWDKSDADNAKELEEGMKGIHGAAGDAFGSIDDLVGQATLMAAAYEEPKTAVETYNEALREQRDLQNQMAGGFLGLVSSMNGVRDSQNTLADAQKEVNRLQNAGKRGTPEYRDALNNLRDAQFGAIESHVHATASIRDYAKQLKESGAPQSKVNDQIREYGKRAGLTRAEIDKLIDEVAEHVRGLGKIPKTKDTKVTANTDPARQAVDALLNKYRGMHVAVIVEGRIAGTGTVRHSGGWIPGAGEVPITAMAGEYIVRKDRSSKYADVLQAINSGSEDDIWHRIAGKMHNGGRVEPRILLELASLNQALHKAATTPALGGNLVQVANSLIGMGFRASGHPAFPPIGGHSLNSWHYKGRAVDFNYGPGGASSIERAAIARVLPALERLPHLELLHPFNDPDHYDHLHYAMRNGAYFNKDRTGMATIHRGEVVSPVPVMRQVVREESGRSEPVVVEVRPRRGAPDFTDFIEVSVNGAITRRVRKAERLNG